VAHYFYCLSAAYILSPFAIEAIAKTSFEDFVMTHQPFSNPAYIFKGDIGTISEYSVDDIRQQCADIAEYRYTAFYGSTLALSKLSPQECIMRFMWSLSEWHITKQDPAESIEKMEEHFSRCKWYFLESDDGYFFEGGRVRADFILCLHPNGASFRMVTACDCEYM